MNGLLEVSQRFIKRNASTILTCIGGAGVVVTSVMAVRATPKALWLIEDAKEAKGDELTKTETVRAAAPAYIPTVLVGASTIACIFGANVLNHRKQASMMSAYALLDSSYKEYRAKVGELYGEDADVNVRTEIAKDKYAGDGFSEDNDKQLFYDEFSGRYFESTMKDVLIAEHELNKAITVDGGAYLNEFYELLGLEPVDYADYMGWSSVALMDMYWHPWVEFEHEKFTFDDGLECYILRMPYEPLYDPENHC